MATNMGLLRSNTPSMLNAVEEGAGTGSYATLAETSDRDLKIERAREEWRAIIDRKLIEWGRDPSQIDEEGIIPPSGRTVRQAIDLASFLGSNGRLSPTRVVADAQGGIVFEHRNGENFETIRINDDGTVLRCWFSGSDLIVHESW